VLYIISDCFRGQDKASGSPFRWFWHSQSNECHYRTCWSYK